jgi:hypothetical protein
MWRMGAVARGKPPNGVIVESCPAQTSESIHILTLNEVSTEYSLLSSQQQHSSLSILQSTLLDTLLSNSLCSAKTTDHLVQLQLLIHCAFVPDRAALCSALYHATILCISTRISDIIALRVHSAVAGQAVPEQCYLLFEKTTLPCSSRDQFF